MTKNNNNGNSNPTTPPATPSAPPFVANAATTATKSIATKIIAGVVAVVVAVGGGIAAYSVINGGEDDRNISDSRNESVVADNGVEQGYASYDENNYNSSGDMESETVTLIPYGQSAAFKDDIVKYLGNKAQYFVTTDGSVYDTMDVSAPICKANSPDDVYCFYNRIAYRNENGEYIFLLNDVEFTLSDIKHEIVAINDLLFEQDIINIFTKDDTGNFYYSEFSSYTWSLYCDTVPITIYDETTNSEVDNIVHIEACHNDVIGTMSYYIVTEDMCYRTTSIGPRAADCFITVSPIHDEYNGIINYTDPSDWFSPIYQIENDSKNLYQIEEEHSPFDIPLPDGYTTSSIKTVYNAGRFWIIVFDDGCVYTYGGETLNMARNMKHSYLTELYKEGQITDFYPIGYNDSTEDFQIIVQMADNSLCSYTFAY